MRKLYLFFILFTLCRAAFPQSYASRNNYTGNWETSTTWSPTWTSPQTSISSYDIAINGYITVNGSLSFTGPSTFLVVDDTLVILGNLSLDNIVIVNGAGIIIVRGDLILNGSASIIANNYFVVTGIVIKNGLTSLGAFIGNGNPEKVFIGGAISPASLTNNNVLYQALNCTSPAYRYPNSNCGYGNMTDFMNDPLYSFFQTTCSITTPTITASGATTFCEGGSVTLTSSLGTSYLWSNGATTQSINVTTAGTYTVRVKNASGCQSVASAATVVTVNALPATPTITAGGPVTFCEGGSVTLTSSLGTSYLWSNGATTQSINVTAAGTYTVRVKNASGCQSVASAATVVTVNALPATPTITAGGPVTFCEGGSVTLTSSLGTSYLWSNGATTQSINVTAAGTYTVRVKNASGCQSVASAATVVTVNALPATPTITAGGPVTFCAGGSVTLTSSLGTSYVWSNGATTQSINVTTAGSYTVSVTNTNGCQSAASVATVVTVNALPATPTITAGGPVTFCEGGSVTLTSSLGTSYLWSTGETTPGINVTTAGSYTVSVTFTSGCQSPASVATVVTVNALPATPTITAGGPVTFCEGGSVTLTSSLGTSYLWSNGATTQSINVTAAGSYTVRVKNASGCQSVASVATVVTVNALPATPTITAGGPVTFCEGGSIILTSSLGTSYLWSTGETTPGINVTTAGSYSVRVKNVSGCQSAASAANVITVNALPVTTVNSNSPICAGNEIFLTSSGGIGYTWSGPEGFTSDEQNPLINNASSYMSGLYSVTVTSLNGCTSTGSLSILVNEYPVANAGPDQELDYVNNTQMQAVLSGSEIGEWSLISGSGNMQDAHSPTTSITGLSAGENIFSWKVQNGNCEAIAMVKLIFNELFIPSVITPNGDGKNDVLIINNGSEQVELFIFNRWGIMEYTNDNYMNEWDGRNNKGIMLSNDTYFYVVKFKNGEIKKGSVLIKR